MAFDSGGYNNINDEIMDTHNLDTSNNKRKYQTPEFESLLNNKRGLKQTSSSNSNTTPSEIQSHNLTANKIKNHYTQEDKGTFSVWITKTKLEGEVLNAFKVGSILYKKHRGIVNIIKRGKFNVEVICKNYSEANSVLDDNELINYGLESFVPGYRKTRKGLIKGLPINISEQDILEGIDSPIKPVGVKRLNKRNKAATSDNDKWVPSQSVIVNFAGQALPPYISIFNVKTEVLPYVSRPMQCFNCFKFGHTSKTCKSKAICIQCGDLKHDGSNCQANIPKCVNCDGEHKSIDSNCHVFQMYHKVNVIMAYDNISYFEAKKIIFADNSEKRKNTLKTKENFPNLRERSLNKFSKSFAKTAKNDNSDFNPAQPLQSLAMSAKNDYSEFNPTQPLQLNNCNTNYLNENVKEFGSSKNKEINHSMEISLNSPKESTSSQESHEELPETTLEEENLPDPSTPATPIKNKRGGPNNKNLNNDNPTKNNTKISDQLMKRFEPYQGKGGRHTFKGLTARIQENMVELLSWSAMA